MTSKSTGDTLLGIQRVAYRYSPPLINSKLQVGNYGAPSLFAMLGNNLWFEAIQLLNEYKMTEELSWRKPSHQRHAYSDGFHSLVTLRPARRQAPEPPTRHCSLRRLSASQGFKVTVIRRPRSGLSQS